MNFIPLSLRIPTKNSGAFLPRRRPRSSVGQLLGCRPHTDCVHFPGDLKFPSPPVTDIPGSVTLSRCSTRSNTRVVLPTRHCAQRALCVRVDMGLDYSGPWNRPPLWQFSSQTWARHRHRWSSWWFRVTVLRSPVSPGCDNTPRGFGNGG